MKVELVSTDYTSIRKSMDQAVELLQNARNFQDVKRSFSVFNQAYIKVASAYSRIFIRMHQDLTDPEPMQRLSEEMDDISSLLYYGPMGKAIRQSPFREQIFSCYGATICNILEFNSQMEEMEQQKNVSLPSFADLQQTYQILCQSLEYQWKGAPIGRSELDSIRACASGDEAVLARSALTDAYLAKEAEFDELLNQMLTRSKRFSSDFGIDCCTYACCAVVARYFYGPEEMLKLCSAIAEKLVPAYARFRATHAAALERPAAKPVGDLFSSVRSIVEGMSLHALKYWDMLVEKNYIDAVPSDTKMAGFALQRFVDDLGAAPLISSPSGTFEDVTQLLHEFGHSLQEKTAFDNRELAFNIVLSADLMEISSQATELMCLHCAGELFDDAEAFAAQFINMIYGRMLASALSTEFECYLFSNPDAPAAAHKAKYQELYRKYFPHTTRNERDILAEMYQEVLFSLGHQYMFCYAFAWLYALELTKDYAKDPWNFYERFRSFNTDITFLTYQQLLEKYQLHNAFEPETIDLFISWLDELL